VDKKYLTSTGIIDSDHEHLIDYAMKVTRGVRDPVEQAVRLYYAVRDDVAYEFIFAHASRYYRASNVLKRRRGFCISKATLLCALARTCGIPSRVCFANVKNHLATEKTISYVGSDLFVFHGITEIFLDGKWVKATPAFDSEFCKKFNVPPLEFNGREDSIFQPYNRAGNQFMEYVIYHGSYADVPVEEILAAWVEFYGEDRVKMWIEDVEETIGDSL